MFIQSGKVKTVSALASSISLSLSNVFLIQSNLFLLRHFLKPQTFRNFVCVWSHIYEALSCIFNRAYQWRFGPHQKSSKGLIFFPIICFFWVGFKVSVIIFYNALFGSSENVIKVVEIDGFLALNFCLRFFGAEKGIDFNQSTGIVLITLV